MGEVSDQVSAPDDTKAKVLPPDSCVLNLLYLRPHPHEFHLYYDS
jgi:hypothetical protein